MFPVLPSPLEPTISRRGYVFPSRRMDISSKEGYNVREVIVVKAIDRAVTKFCYKHPHFGIRNLMLYIIAGSGLVYIFAMMDTTNTLLGYLSFNPGLIVRGQVWRLVTFLFMPSGSSPFWEIVALYFYFFIGSNLERQWGTNRFTIYYLSGVALNVIFGFISYYALAASGAGTAGADMIVEYTMNAEYLNLSLFFAFASIWPDAIVRLFFFIPIKMKWAAWIDAAVFAAGILGNMPAFPFNLLPVIAILNFFLFCWGNLNVNLKRDRTVSRRRSEFRASVHQAQNEEKLQGYRHKCEVCGRTDVSDPDLEFRYCSRCQGYHCYCADHINTHIHHTE